MYCLTLYCSSGNEHGLSKVDKIEIGAGTGGSVILLFIVFTVLLLLFILIMRSKLINSTNVLKNVFV